MTMKDSKIIKGKLEGKTSIQIGEEVGMKPQSVRKRLQNATIKDALAKALEKHNLTIDRVLKPIDEALDASNAIYSKDGTFIDSIPNHTVRLAASDRASKLMGLDKVHDKTTDTPESLQVDNEAILKAIESGDTVTLQQVIFSRGS